MLLLIINWFRALFAAKGQSQISKTIQQSLQAAMPTEILNALSVSPAVYEDQKDNPIGPNETCAVTSNSMLLQGLNLPENGGIINGIHRQLENDILTDMHEHFAYWNGQAKQHLGVTFSSDREAREDFYFIAMYNKIKFGVVCEVKKMSTQEIFDYVKSTKLTIIMSTGKALTSCGHINLCRGVFEDSAGKYFLNNDPYGEYPYHNWKKSGEQVRYPISMFPPAVWTIKAVSWPKKGA